MSHWWARTLLSTTPSGTWHGQTAMVCAKFLKEIAATMLRNGKEKTQLVSGIWP